MQERLKFSASATANAEGIFEVLLITEGQGNGWRFSAECLKNSIPLWEGAECFIDHIGVFGKRQSVRDLCGIFYNVAFDESARGVRAKLKTLGPSGALAAQLGKEWLALYSAHEPCPAIGFSADIGFIASDAKHTHGRDVLEITRVYSCDLVFEPARGGAFIRALNSVPYSGTKGVSMGEETKIGAEVRQQLNTTTEQARLAQESETARQMRRFSEAETQMLQYLLESGLAASKLPSAMQTHVRKQFTGKIFEPNELTSAIEDARKVVSELTGRNTVQGLRATVSGMFNSDDQLEAAVYDLFDAPRPKELEGLHTARLSGIKELYLGMTGDSEMYGGIYLDRARFQHTTANFVGLVKNALNKALIRHWEQLGRAGYDWWQKVAHVEHFGSLQQITWTIFGSVGALPTVAEGAEYTELKIGDSPETSNFTKYGGYIGITLEAIDRDETRKLRAVPRELANGAIRNISALCAALFTDNAGVGPTLADGGALFNNTAVTTAGGHANLRTTALGSGEWDTVQTNVFNQPMLVANESGYYGTGKKLAVHPRYLLVPRSLWLTGAQILYPALERAATYNTQNLQRGEHGDVLVVPEWTDTNDWAAVCDPAIVPGICIGERFGLMPEIYIAGDEQSPAVFMNDESRIKVRHFVAVGVCDFRPLAKNNV